MVKSLRYLKVVMCEMKKLGFLVGVTSVSVCCCAASDFVEDLAKSKKISLDAGKIYKGDQVTNLVELSWVGSSSVKYLKKVEIIGTSLDKLIDLTISIPGEVDGKRVAILSEAFKDLKSNNNSVRLHLRFKEKNGKKVNLPRDCVEMFSGSSAIYSLDFKGVDTSQTTKMNEMFFGCKNITSLDLRYFNTNQLMAADLERMLVGCSGLRLLNVSSFRSELTTDKGLYYMLTERSDAPLNDIPGLYEYYIQKRGLKVIVGPSLSTSALKRANDYAQDSDSVNDSVYFGNSNSSKQSTSSCSNTPKRKVKDYMESRIENISWTFTEPREKTLVRDLGKDFVSKKYDKGSDTEIDKNEIAVVLPRVNNENARFTKEKVIVNTAAVMQRPKAEGCYYVHKERIAADVIKSEVSNRDKNVVQDEVEATNPADKISSDKETRCYFSGQDKDNEGPRDEKEQHINKDAAKEQKIRKNEEQNIEKVLETNKQVQQKSTWYSCIVKVWRKFVSACKRLATYVVSSFK